MKSSLSLIRSRGASITKAERKAEIIKRELLAIKSDGSFELHMPKIRAALAELNQRVHEANAFNNSLTTE